MSFRWRSHTLALGLVLVVTSALAQACGDDDNSAGTSATPDGGVALLDATPPAPVSTPTQASATVGASGGSVKTTTGTGVEIPAGALSGNVNITVAQAAAATPATGALSSAFQFSPSGLPFSAPVTVVIEYDPSKLPAGKTAADVVIMTAPDSTTNFTALATSPRDGTHVTCQTTHFSIYVAMIAGTVVDSGTTGGGDDDDADSGGSTDSGGGGGGDGGGNGDGGGGGKKDAGTDAATDDAGDDAGAADASDDADAGTGN